MFNLSFPWGNLRPFPPVRSGQFATLKGPQFEPLRCAGFILFLVRVSLFLSALVSKRVAAVQGHLSLSSSHLPTHSITVYPMVTIRISDRQRLIQPYLHNYSWLLFAALTLYTADLANGEEAEGEKLDAQLLSHARVLQRQCIQLIGDCLMKAQHGKGESAPPSLKHWFEPGSEVPGIASCEISKGKRKLLCFHCLWRELMQNKWCSGSLEHEKGVLRQ